MPSTDPTERSRLRVMMTIVSPIASNAMIDAAERICWTFVALRKLGLSIVAATTTSASASRIPSSRKRNRSSARACELARASMTFCSSATVVILGFRLQAPGWQRRRTRRQSRHVLTTAPTSGASCASFDYRFPVGDADGRAGKDGTSRRRRRKAAPHAPLSTTGSRWAKQTDAPAKPARPDDGADKRRLIRSPPERRSWLATPTDARAGPARPDDGADKRRLIRPFSTTGSRLATQTDAPAKPARPDDGAD